VLKALWSAVRSHDRKEQVADLATLHLGPNCILIAVTLRGAGGQRDLDFQEEIERLLKAADPRVLDVLFRYGAP
jgi:hypothetical protein